MPEKSPIKKVCVIGGGGYVGAVLAPMLLSAGYKVTVYDLFIYGMDVFPECASNQNLTLVKGDVRDIKTLSNTLKGLDAVIHLACISNDPSVELDPNLAKSINLDCFPDCVKSAKKHGVKRFIYASSSSVYGIKETENVTEDMPLSPLTDYSRFKAACEDIALTEAVDAMTTLVLRPATVCGYSPRQRLDLTVNILTNHAVNKGKITVFGGTQKRPNIHIKDICNVYINALKWEHAKIHKKIFNAGYENFTLMQIADMVKEVVGPNLSVVVEPTDDLRSYHISSAKIKKELGYEPSHSIKDAIADLTKAFSAGVLHDPLNNPLYYNIKQMNQIHLK